VKLIDIYIRRNVLTNILLVLLILVGLFTFFSFIDELDDIGKERYGVLQAIQFVALEIPRHIYELFPSATLLGSLLGLGMMANNNELTVIRAAGVSILRIALAIFKVGIVLTLVAMLIGETLAPYSEQYARNSRALAQSEHNLMAFNSRYGFWAHDGNNFINISVILSDGGFGGITLYQFNQQQQLQHIIVANRAYYEKDRWLLEQVKKTSIGATQVTSQQLDKATWNAILNPELVKLVVINPQKLSSFGLLKYISYLKQNAQDYSRYELALWSRLSYPLVSITMIFLAIPFVFGSLRSVSIGQRILVGALLGIGFYMLNQISSYIGLVYELHPAMSALLSPVIFLITAIILMRRTI